MDMWIETVAGSLVKADSVTHVVIRENTGTSTWDVSVSASAAPALFASTEDETSARKLRNSLVIQMAGGNPRDGAHIIAYAAAEQAVSAYGLAA